MVPAASPVLLFDVNGTLSDLSPLKARLVQVGAPDHLLPAWFAGVLRDGFALTAAGGFASFADIARDVLMSLLSGLTPGPGDVGRATDHVLEGMSRLPLHPDVADSVRELRAAGFRLVTMTNGTAGSTETLLGQAGLVDCFEALLDVSGPRCWKPAAAAYHHAVEHCAARPRDVLLVAVHPWDVDGAQRAGLGGAWLRRGATYYPHSLRPPARTADDLRDLAAGLLGG